MKKNNNSRLRIGLDGTTLQPERSGVGFYTEHLFASLLAVDGKNEYVVLSNSEVRSDMIPADLVHEGYRFPVRGIWMQTILPLLLNRKKVDVCHYTNYISPLWSSCPAVVTFHDMTVSLLPRYSSWKKRLLLRSLIPLVARKADAIIVVSESTRRDVLRTLRIPKEKIHLIQEGVTPEFKPVTNKNRLEQVKARYGLCGPYFIAVGTVEPRKNLVRLAQAFHQVRRETGRNLKLLIVGGKGFQSDRILREVKEAAGEHVIWTGYAPSNDLPSLYSCAEALVYTSLYEGFGLPVLEAMACATPVITSNNSSLKEVAGDAALLVDPENVEDISNSMRRIIEDKTLYNMLSNKGIERASHFSWEEAARRTLKVYQAVHRSGVGERAKRRNGEMGKPKDRLDSLPRFSDSPNLQIRERLGRIMDPGELAVIKTAVYSSLFDYPLKFEEMHRGLFDYSLTESQLDHVLSRCNFISQIEHNGRTFFMLKGKEKSLGTRLGRERENRVFLSRMRRPINLLCGLPFVRMVALSGGSALSYGDDLDLFMITSPKRVWTVTLFSVLVSKALGLRRTICTNYLVDEDTLRIPGRSFFTAHQILTLKPVYGLPVYDRFVRVNGWVRGYFPNFKPITDGGPFIVKQGSQGRILERIINRWWDGVEGMVRSIYGRYLRWKTAPFSGSDVALTHNRIQLNVVDHKGEISRRFEEALKKVRR